MTKNDQQTQSIDARSSVRKRTWVSFVIFFVCISTAISIWIWIRHQPAQLGISGPFRMVLEWNGKVWSKLYSSDRMSISDSPPEGKRPRFNGNIGLTSSFKVSDWKMEIVANDADAKSKKFQVTLDELKALPKTETSTEFKCIEGWSEEISYAGVRFSEFLKYYHLGTYSEKEWDEAVKNETKPKNLFNYVGMETPDGKYYVSIDMVSMLHPQTLLAYEMNGKPLDIKNGAPLRLIIPIKYGIKSLKRIGKIFFSDRRPPDYWAERGYDWFAGL